ncbi:hypothetical protein PYCCODRAFT_1440175 [Trametes coccinea BRFM310]|uniref:Uncharacterized protein n=1 Tax=Trametes coccinea (strain BRFM310) TaxID=1353009 RepID=A0A1Y2IAP7_TRAC3|nr:hypothetical protein PYCCODRAFT_1440175 [Trametes coccinea BRFM310]
MDPELVQPMTQEVLPPTSLLPDGASAYQMDISTPENPIDHPLTEQDIQQLSSRRDLLSLSGHLILPPGRSSFILPANAPRNPFWMLQELNLKATSDAIAAFATMVVGLSCLKRLSLQVLCGDPSMPAIPPVSLIATIARMCDDVVLRSLCVRAHGDDAGPEALALVEDTRIHAPDVHVYYRDFLPLIRILAIREFRFDLPWTFHLDDDLLSYMAEQWSHLEHFHLATAPYAKVHPGTTLAAFPDFGVHCPRLETLGFPFDGTTFGGRDDSPPVVNLGEEYYSQADQCTALHVVNSPIKMDPDDQFEVALFLSYVFPRLSEITGSFSDAGAGYARAWDMVEDRVRALSAIRENERERNAP